MLHAHYESETTDCDGRYTRAYAVVANQGEDEDDFRTRLLGSVVGEQGRLEVVAIGDGTTRFEWGEPTEEGQRHVQVETCRKACDLDQSLFRDHSAEKAGY